MGIHPAAVEEKYQRLGFAITPLGMELKIGRVKISAAEHPWKGVVLIFTCFEPRRRVQFDVGIPTVCSVEQIAAMIYANFLITFRDQAACRAYFESLEIHAFQ